MILKDQQGKERICIGRITETSGAGGGDAPTVTAEYWGIRIKAKTAGNLVEVGRLPAGGVAGAEPDISFILGGGGAAASVALRDDAASS